MGQRKTMAQDIRAKRIILEENRQLMKKRKNNRIPIIQITDPDLRAAYEKAAALFFGKTSSDTNSSGS